MKNEVEKSKFEKVVKILKDNNIFNEIIGVTQKNNFEMVGEFKNNINDLYNTNNKWYYNY